METRQLTIFDQLIGTKVRLFDRIGFIVMVEDDNFFVHHSFEKANKTPYSKMEFIYTVCYSFDELDFNIPK